MFNRTEYMAEYNRRHYQENRLRILRRKKKQREENPESFKRSQAKWYAEHGSQYREENREKLRDNANRYNRKPTTRRKMAKRIAVDDNLRLRHLYSARIGNAIHRNSKQAIGTERLLGCTITEARQHLQNQFAPWMTWKNHGEWTIDHIKPLSAFELTDERQVLKALHYTNMQPLGYADNIRKGNR